MQTEEQANAAAVEAGYTVPATAGRDATAIVFRDVETGAYEWAPIRSKSFKPQRGVTAMSDKTEGSVTKAHRLFDSLYDEHGADLTRKMAMEQAEAMGINKATASTQWQKWRQGYRPRALRPVEEMGEAATAE